MPLISGLQYQIENQQSIEMIDQKSEINNQPSAIRNSNWLDLVLYLVIGFGAFFASGYALRGVLHPGDLLSSAIIYALNIVSFIGTVYLVGVRRGRLSWQGIGLIPPRWKWNWLLLALLVVIAFYPLRILLALLITLLFEGNLNSIVDSARMQVLVPTGFNWLNFSVTLLMAGIIAPISEELFFRGALFTWFREHFSLWPAILFSSLLFALGHIDTLAVVVTS
ncbi:MAG: CPBP family intramembrane metalloprotease, partial [Anaerolineaceae bacterium]|nr:CPBP family intramembrane metalloprotease [Anaerolineaceae bacterium]